MVGAVVVMVVAVVVYGRAVTDVAVVVCATVATSNSSSVSFSTLRREETIEPVSDCCVM